MSEYSAPTQFIDLAAQQELIRPQLEAAVKRVLQYIMGPEVRHFEDNLREFTGAKHALTPMARMLTLVLMTMTTYVASAEAPAQLGATPFLLMYMTIPIIWTHRGSRRY